MRARQSLLAVALAVAAFASSCGDDTDGNATPSTTSAASGATTTSASTAPTTTGAPPASIDPSWPLYEESWFVWGVAAGDVLNVRSAAGPSQPIVTTLAPGARGVRRYDTTTTVDGEVWQPVQVAGGAGWVNVRFLRPEVPATPTVEGTRDPTLESAAAAVVDALEAGDFAGLAALVHPTRGVTVSTDAHLDEVDPVLSRAQVQGAGNDPSVVLWGHEDGTGDPIRQTVRERLGEVAGSTAVTSTTTIGFDHRVRTGNTIDNLAARFPGDHVVEYHFAGTSRYGDFDWTSVRIVFDTSGSSPALVGVVEDTWTI